MGHRSWSLPFDAFVMPILAPSITEDVLMVYSVAARKE
jgi:hypothetical protein